MSGRWIAFEGGEGSGKSTQAARFAARHDALLTREPGGTALGAKVRSLLLDPDEEIDPRAETLLMIADRAQHVASVVRPALAAGRMVVSDRSAFSSLAYQGYGRGIDVEEIRAISDWASTGWWPELAVLLDVPDDVRAARLQRDHDRMERAGDDFHDRVNAGFRAMAAEDPLGWLVIDGSPPADEVEAAVSAAYEAWLRSWDE